MEEKLIYELDRLDTHQTDSLLNEKLAFELDRKALKRIKSSVYKKAGLSRARSLLKKAAAVVAAAIVLLAVSTALVGVENVAEAFSRLFGFIPGYGIVENNQDIKFIARESKLRAENNQAIMTVRTVLAGKNSLSISFEVEKKAFDESKALEEKKELEELLKRDALKKPDIRLFIKGKEYRSSSSSTGGGGKLENTHIYFEIPEELINDKISYTLVNNQFGLSLDFTLQPCASYGSLQEIGPTDVKNNISITAVPKKDGNRLEVELYTVNKSKFNIYSYAKEDDKGYKGMDISLMTSSGRHGYKTPEGYMGANNRFYFDVNPEEAKLVLNIPYLIVEGAESSVVSLTVPEEGKILKLNKEVAFEDSTMIITQVEKVARPENEYGALRISLACKNSNPGMVLKNTAFNRVDTFGITKGGGYLSVPDENGIIKAIEYELEQGENDKLRLNISRPQYYLLGEYNLEIDGI
ncbi:hypothetical protein CLHUN_05200 [Ruminiclostridium hungatei]|uniref:DUF4179 domain-containing protein n=1 Tax=Ruminiclostridium hungatei TaxID=48256 RepID=A0A1V4SRH2_RUMHU|nr:hypothetical protein [Ruminiclostridium hungatei]OPX46045.1 hypothetical protein CLHUN_05200 [Ruminiclostridium hungatei]